MNRLVLFRVLLFSCLSAGGAAEAEIVKIVYERKPYENGKSFGTIGPYERITGTAFGEVHPADPHNSMIVDIDKAPRNSRGRVEYEAQFVVIRPVDATKANGALIHSVPNRGNEGRIDAFRLRQGFTLSSSPLDLPPKAGCPVDSEAAQDVRAFHHVGLSGHQGATPQTAN